MNDTIISKNLTEKAARNGVTRLAALFTAQFSAIEYNFQTQAYYSNRHNKFIEKLYKIGNYLLH